MANTKKTGAKKPATGITLEGRVVTGDEAFDFDLDGILERDAADPAPPFRFPLKGTIYELPNARSLSLRQADRMTADSEAVLAEVAGEETADLLANLPTGALTELLEAWMAHAGLGGGKSRGSSRR